MKTKPNIATIISTAAMLGLSAAAFAGQPTAPPPATAAANPLSFMDGKVVFDVQERLRWEIRENNFDFNDNVRTVNDDNWFLQRFRLGLAIKPTDWLTIYGQVQDSREWLSDRADFPGVLGAEGDDPFDLRQAYIEIGNPKHLSLKLGRQVLSYGDERLIGAFEWNNIGRTFDAVKLSYKSEKLNVDAFASTVVVPQRKEYNQSDLFNGNETERSQIFSGIYASSPIIPWQTTDLYVFHLHEEQITTETNFFTIGTRMKSAPGKLGPWDYSTELALQVGEVRDLDLLAFAANVEGGYTFGGDMKPRIGLGYSYGSGDGDPTDGDVETFQNLFPTNHKFYGQMDVFSWQNMHNLELNFKFAPTKKLSVKAAAHAFWLATTDDSWYRANGVATVRPLTPAARSASNYVGAELDLTVTYALNKNVSFEGGYSHFFAGDYLSDTGASDDADFAYLQTTISF